MRRTNSLSFLDRPSRWTISIHPPWKIVGAPRGWPLIKGSNNERNNGTRSTTNASKATRRNPRTTRASPLIPALRAEAKVEKRDPNFLSDGMAKIAGSRYEFSIKKHLRIVRLMRRNFIYGATRPGTNFPSANTNKRVTPIHLGVRFLFPGDIRGGWGAKWIRTVL